MRQSKKVTLKASLIFFYRKKQVLNHMTEQHPACRIERCQAKQLDMFQVNEHVESYFVEENKEEESLRNLFK